MRSGGEDDRCRATCSAPPLLRRQLPIGKAGFAKPGFFFLLRRSIVYYFTISLFFVANPSKLTPYYEDTWPQESVKKIRTSKEHGP